MADTNSYLSKPVVTSKIDNKKLKDRYSVLYISDAGGSSLVLTSDKWYYEFNIQKTSKEDPNKGDIKIYGLGKDSRSFIDSKAKYILLYAGYGSQVDLLFAGVISDVFHEKESENVATSIQAQDGANSYRYAYINKSYRAGTKVRDILNDLINTYGCSSVEYDKESIPEDLKFMNGRTLNGNASKYLKEICNFAGLEYSVQNDILQIHSKGGYNGRECYLIRQDTGLIGSPQRMKRKKRKNGIDQDINDENKIKFKVLLNPDLIPSTVVKIESMFINSYYVIREITFSGSASLHNNDSEYVADVEAQEIVDTSSSTTTDDTEVKNVPKSDFIKRMDKGEEGGKFRGHGAGGGW